MSSLLAEHLSKYGYQVHRPDGRGYMEAEHHPHEQRLFDLANAGAWPIVMDIQTVADYVHLQREEFVYKQHPVGESDEDVHNLHKDLKEGGLTMVPPYPLMFLEYTVNQKVRSTQQRFRVGTILQTFRMSDLDPKDPSTPAIAFQAVQDGAGDAEWFVEVRSIIEVDEGRPILQPAASTVYLDEHGAFITGHTDILVEGKEHDVAGWRLNAEWTTFLAMNACKFVHVRKASVREADDVDTRRRQKKAARKGRPFIRHHKLIIEPLERHMAYVRSLGPMTPGSVKALHAVRGHFATYTAERPLGRGKFVGTVWKPPHMRGSKKLGFVTKDYETGSLDE